MGMGFVLSLFILKERVHAQAREGQRERERETKNPQQAPHCATEPIMGLKPTNGEIMTPEEIKIWTPT